MGVENISFVPGTVVNGGQQAAEGANYVQKIFFNNISTIFQQYVNNISTIFQQYFCQQHF